MKFTVPPLWPATSYIRPVRAESGGQMALTHLAELKDPDGTLCRGYVKHFPSNQPRALFNEWFGHTLMSSFGVPQPCCAIMEAPIFGSPTNASGLAFVSCQPRPSFEGTPKEIYNWHDAGELQTLIDRLFDCPSLPLLIAADQFLINADRNIGNLVFTGRKTFVAIDHGEILGGGLSSEASLLRPTSWARSKLIEGLVQIKDLKPAFKNAIMASAQIAEEQFYECQIDLKAALDCGVNTHTSIAMDAVWWRCLNVAQWFKLRLQLVV
jgi:hypothetical protein